MGLPPLLLTPKTSQLPTCSRLGASHNTTLPGYTNIPRVNQKPRPLAFDSWLLPVFLRSSGTSACITAGAGAIVAVPAVITINLTVALVRTFCNDQLL